MTLIPISLAGNERGNCDGSAEQWPAHLFRLGSKNGERQHGEDRHSTQVERVRMALRRFVYSDFRVAEYTPPAESGDLC